MAAPVEMPPHLPTDLAITERSRAFYDGTYKWDCDGFTDDHGVYREFDCYDPLARAPTPLPPRFSDDDEDNDQEEDAVGESGQTLKADSAATSVDVAALEPDTPCPKLDYKAPDMFEARTSEESHRSTMASVDNIKQTTTSLQDVLSTTSQDKLSAKYIDSGALVSELHGIATAPRQAGAEVTVKEDYRLSGASNPVKEVAGTVKMPDTPPSSPIKTGIEVQATSPTSTISTLSPVPSNLSDQDMDVGCKIKGASATPRSTPSLPNTPSKSSPQSKAKTSTTRGVAQKGRKGSKANKSSPLKRKTDSVEDFTLKELHSGAFMRRSERRRSVRQAKDEGD